MMDHLENDIIYFTLTPQSPFAIRHLPLLGRIYRIGYPGPPFSRWKRVTRFVGRIAYRIMRAAGFGGIGVMDLRQDGKLRELRFNVRNTQFHAVYVDQHLPCYEPETTSLIDQLLGKEDVFFDVGANWGWYAIAIANKPAFLGAVHAFEPNPNSFADLSSVVSQTGLGNLITCHELALGVRDGETRMSVPDGVHSGGATLDQSGNLKIKLARLDSLDLPKPKVIKLDVEDHEYEALIGAQRTIADARPFLIFENWSYPMRPEVTSAPLVLLEEWGYKLYLHAWIASNGSPYRSVNWSGGRANFALIPFSARYRGLFSSDANIVAAPAEKVGDLRSILEKTPEH